MIPSNFKFLADEYDFLCTLVTAAEKNRCLNPEVSLVKLRDFGDALAKYLVRLLALPMHNAHASQINTLKCFPFATGDVIAIFQYLAAPNLRGENTEKEVQLRLGLAYHLAVWFHRVATRAPDFHAPEYALIDADETYLVAYLQKLNQLKLELLHAEQAEVPRKAVFYELKAKKTALNGVISILESGVKETRQQTGGRLQALFADLKNKDGVYANQNEAANVEIKQIAQSLSISLSDQEVEVLSLNNSCFRCSNVPSEND